RLALTKELSLNGGVSARWSGESQAHVGLGWKLGEASTVYASERFGLRPAGVGGPMTLASTTVLGGETEVAPGSRAYAEYQLESAFSGLQNRGVVGLANRWKLPFGFALSANYERIVTLGGVVPTTESNNVPPAAFTDGTFFA